MKRLLFWRIPLTLALLAGGTFAWGFYMVAAGGAGVAVHDREPARRNAPVPSQELRLLILGDSLARGTGDETGMGIGGAVAAELARRGVKHRTPVNLAINGARTVDLLRQLESSNVRRLIEVSDIVIVSVGGNDLFGDMEGRSVAPADPGAVMDDVLDRIDRVIASIREANPSVRIFLLGLYNPFRSLSDGARVTSLVRDWNARLIDRFREDANIEIVQTADLFSHRDLLSLDRFHPGKEGYAIIGRRIAEGI
ncbi:MAG TPA: GDSL-type esterase/lipase family protein [Thermoanaerobaculia bacterium]|nr:GDSL-type esterase/lipase family protein [Thermoanaerobaculia bacterium]